MGRRHAEQGGGRDRETSIYNLSICLWGCFPVAAAALDAVVGCRNREDTRDIRWRLKGGGRGKREGMKRKDGHYHVRGIERTTVTTVVTTVIFSRLYLPIADKVRGEKRGSCPNLGVYRQGEQ
jgi:hypothetical protein